MKSMGINLKTFSEFAHSRSVPDLPKTINLPLANEKTPGPPKVPAYANNSRLDSRRPSLPVTIGLNHLNYQAWFYIESLGAGTGLKILTKMDYRGWH